MAVSRRQSVILFLSDEELLFLEASGECMFIVCLKWGQDGRVVKASFSVRTAGGITVVYLCSF